MLNTPEHAACPHCKKINQGLDTESGAPSDLAGCVFVCDHCQKRFEVVSVVMVPALTIAPYPRPARRG